jgi:hypothetical protein
MSTDAKELRKGDRIRAMRKGNPALQVEGVVDQVSKNDLTIDGINQWFVGNCWVFHLVERARVLPTEPGWYARASSLKRSQQGSLSITLWRLSPSGNWSHFLGSGDGWTIEQDRNKVPDNLVRLIPEKTDDGC